MFIICFTNSNVDERSCLGSLFGLSVALFSTVFYFCKVTDLASPLFRFFFTLSFLLFLRCSRLHAVVTQLRVFVDCVGLKYLQPGSCFFPSLCLSSPCSSIPLFDHLLWGCQLFRSNTRVWRHSADPVPKPTPTQSSCLSGQGHQGPSAFSKNHVFS